MSSWTPAGRWGFAQGITHAFGRIGNAAPPPLMAAMLAVISWRASFYILGFVSLGWLLAWALYFRNDPRDHPAITQGDLDSLPERARGTKPVDALTWLRLARRILPVTI